MPLTLVNIMSIERTGQQILQLLNSKSIQGFHDLTNHCRCTLLIIHQPVFSTSILKIVEIPSSVIMISNLEGTDFE